MSFTPSRVRLALVSAGLVTLAACGGGGGGGDAAPATTSVTVSPSLGKFSAGAKVTIKKLDGTVLGSGNTTSAGTAVINVGTYSGAMLVEVTGGTGVTYYDEKDGSTPNFGATDSLTAVAPSVTTALGVTPATHAAVEAIKAVNSGAVPSGLTSASINLANTRIATALGITDVLQPPALVDGSTGTTLDVADAKGKYALQLAALAKLAGTGKTALDVAKDLAKDLSDNKLDGQFDPTAIGGTGAPVQNTATSYTGSTVKTALETQLKAAATTFGTTETKNLVNSDPTVAGTVTSDVSAVSTPSGTDSSDIQKAKSFFAELRTTMGAFFGAGGFTDTQGTRINTQISTYVAPAIERVVYRLGVLGDAVKVYAGTEQGSEDLGLVVNAGGQPFQFKRQESGLGELWNKASSTFHVCGTLAVPRNSVTCYIANSGSITKTSETMGTIKVAKFVVSPKSGSPGIYDYTNTMEIATVTNVVGNNVTFAAYPFTDAGVPAQTGTVTPSGSSYTVTGKFVPSTQNTGPDDIAVTGTRTLVSGTVYSNALSGTVTTPNKTDTDKKVIISLNSGSFVKVDDSKKGSNQGDWVQEMDLSLSAEHQDLNKIVGRVQVSGLTYYKNNTGVSPARVEFTGKLYDLKNAAPTTPILDGSVLATQTNQAGFDEYAPVTDSNYPHVTFTLTGKVKNPERPEMKVVLTGTATGANKGTVSFNYTYDTVSVTGSGSQTAENTGTLTLSNQAGLQLARKTGDGTTVELKKSSALLASLKAGIVSYVDGSTESIGSIVTGLGSDK